MYLRHLYDDVTRHSPRDLLSLRVQQVLPSWAAVFNQYILGHARVLSNRRHNENKEASYSPLKSSADSILYLVKSGIVHPESIVELTPFDLIPVKTRVSKSDLPWMVSHTSNRSFELNKNPPSTFMSGLFSSKSTLFDRHTAGTHHLYLSARTFKTRSKSAGIGSQSNRDDNDRDVAEDALEHLDSKRGDKMTAAVTTEEAQKDLLKFLTGESLTKEEVQKLKVAYAEGFFAGRKKTNEKPTNRFLKAARDSLSVVTAIAFLIFLVFMSDVSFGGSNGRLRNAFFKHVREVLPEDIDVRFDDVKGVNEAKKELEEVVDFLQAPEKYSALGGKLPKGVLLVGPPGTGKTLLARAVAGEAQVPFFHASGSEFDEIFVGQGARRIRELFERARLRAPCVIFIDEIDSVGQTRTTSAVHPYANQTVNQLLTEMDGFSKQEGIVIIAATNRQDNLDPALLRPGRFDVRVTVSPPDLEGRVELFDFYLSKIVVASTVNAQTLARKTVGFTGADIENMVNQAAIRAAMDNAPWVTMDHLWFAYDKIVMGPEKHGKKSDEDKRITAFHESGHTLVAFFTKDSIPVHKVTITARGGSLGHTSFIPEKDFDHMTRAQMLSRIDSCLGGRAAEELIFGTDKITSGAASDLKEATNVARQMVTAFGMSDKAGLSFVDEHVSPAKQEIIDEEVRRILNESYDRVKSLLKSHQNELKLLAEALLKYDTLDGTDVKLVIEGKEPTAAHMTLRESKEKARRPPLKPRPKTPIEF